MPGLNEEIQYYGPDIAASGPRIKLKACQVQRNSGNQSAATFVFSLFQVNAFANGFQSDLTVEMHSSLSYCFYNRQPFCFTLLPLPLVQIGLAVTVNEINFAYECFKLIPIARGITDRSSSSPRPFDNSGFQLTHPFVSST